MMLTQCVVESNLLKSLKFVIYGSRMFFFLFFFPKKLKYC